MRSPATLVEAAQEQRRTDPEAPTSTPASADALAVEMGISEQAITELERAKKQVLRETDTGVTEEQRDRLIQIQTDRALHEERLTYLGGRLLEVRRDDARADAGRLYGELAERQHEAIARAETAFRPAVWTRLTKTLDGAVEGLQVLREAHAARCNRQALRAAFGDELDDLPVEEVPPLELGVRERLMGMERQIIDVFAACDRTAALSVGRVPHRPSSEVSELLERREDLLETE